MDIAKEIKKLLIDMDMSQTDLADKLGTSQGNIANKLKRNNPSVKELEEIAEAIGYKLEINFIPINEQKK